MEYCGKQSTCVNNDDDTRGLTCECSSGYTAHRIFLGEERKLLFEFHLSISHTGCRDLDECTEGGKKCKANTDCVNTDGGHHCVCQIGFEGDPCEMLLGCLNFDHQSNFPDTGCTDIDECKYFPSANFTYLCPTFLNLPGDEWTSSFYQPEPCPPADSCVNLNYKDGVGFKCVPVDQTYAAVMIGGLHWNNKADVLKADLSRCDGAVPPFPSNVYHHRVSKSCDQYS